MIRTLTIVAIVGFLLCIVSIAGAFGIMGGPFAIHDWTIRRFGHEFSHSDWHGHGWRVERGGSEDALASDGPAVTRDFPGRAATFWTSRRPPTSPSRKGRPPSSP